MLLYLFRIQDNYWDSDFVLVIGKFQVFRLNIRLVLALAKCQNILVVVAGRNLVCAIFHRLLLPVSTLPHGQMFLCDTLSYPSDYQKILLIFTFYSGTLFRMIGSFECAWKSSRLSSVALIFSWESSSEGSSPWTTRPYRVASCKKSRE